MNSEYFYWNIMITNCDFVLPDFNMVRYTLFNGTTTDIKWWHRYKIANSLPNLSQGYQLIIFGFSDSNIAL